MNSSRTALASEHCVADAPALDAAGIDALRPGSTGWAIADGMLTRHFDFPDFHHTMAFVNAVAWIAHRQDHHPDLAVSYDHCDVAWSTHSAGGLTRNDFICASRVEALVAA